MKLIVVSGHHAVVEAHSVSYKGATIFVNGKPRTYHHEHISYEEVVREGPFDILYTVAYANAARRWPRMRGGDVGIAPTTLYRESDKLIPIVRGRRR